MTQYRIIELAREAGAYICTSSMVPDSIPEISFVPQKLERFAHLVRAQALEEAAGVCENTLAQHYMKQVILTHDQALLLAACADCAAAIRALKEQT